MRQKFLRGDTMVEVMLAMTFFSLVTVGIYALVRTSFISTNESLEYNQVRNYIDSQATNLRFLQASYMGSYNNGSAVNGPGLKWKTLRDKIISNSPAVVTDFGVGTSTCPNIPTTSFVLNPKTSDIVFADDGTGRFKSNFSGLSRLEYNDDNSISNIYGIWIEAKRDTSSSGGSTYFIDFYIRSCWYRLGSSSANTLATIVRLYDI